MRWKRLRRRSLTRSNRGLRWGLPEVVGTVQVHYSQRRLLRRGLEFHVSTINKSTHTKKSLETYLMILVYIYIYIHTLTYIFIHTHTHTHSHTHTHTHTYIYIYIYIYIYTLLKPLDLSVDNLGCSLSVDFAGYERLFTCVFVSISLRFHTVDFGQLRKVEIL